MNLSLSLSLSLSNMENVDVRSILWKIQTIYVFDLDTLTDFKLWKRSNQIPNQIPNQNFFPGGRIFMLFLENLKNEQAWRGLALDLINFKSVTICYRITVS